MATSKSTSASDRYSDIESCIRQRHIDSIVKLMFDLDDDNLPIIRSGFRIENDLWDFKASCPLPGKTNGVEWAEIAKHVLAFHNHNGGIIVFGIRDNFSFCGVDHRLDSKLFNDQVRKFLGDRIWVEFHREFIQSNQKYVGIALVPQRGAAIERFRTDATAAANGSRLFVVGGSAIRKNDSSFILTKTEADELSRKLAIPNIGQVYCVDVPFYRILQPEYIHFVDRTIPCKMIEEALSNPRAAIASVVGIGGAGKTALATWAVLRAYERKEFDFIVSITAKDRELTASGIRALEPSLTSFESLLDNIAEVLGFSELKTEPLDSKEQSIKDLLKGNNGLLFVDNLETVDDARIITFLDNLPLGVRAVVTSRRATVRVSVHPIDLGPLTEEEIQNYIASLAEQQGFKYLQDLSAPERLRIGMACDGTPLAIRWVLARSKSAAEALSNAESITRSERRGEELLEFCFRRVFEKMLDAEKAVLQVLSLFQRPIPTEAILLGSDIPHSETLDAIEVLVSDSLVQRLFDPDRNDYCYSLFPSARAFVYKQVNKQPKLEEKIRKSLTDWFEAKDITDENQRLVIREVRQGKGASETALLDLAAGAVKRKDFKSARELYEQARRRNPAGWRAPKFYAEFCRHSLKNTAEALAMYEQAAANAPRRGFDRAIIFREWGMLLKDSGQPEATNTAIEKFEIALQETPNDEYTIHALADMLGRKGMFGRVITLLEPLAQHSKISTRKKTLPLLLRAYEKTNDMLKAEETRQQIRRLGD